MNSDFHHRLIVALGGKTKLARDLGISRVHLNKWHSRGIPASYWHRVMELAAAAGLRVTAEQLRQTKPSATTKQAVENVQCLAG